jgi:hypothetical protein
MPNIDKVMRVIVDSCAGSTAQSAAGTEGAKTSYSSSSKRPKSFNEDCINDFI